MSKDCVMIAFLLSYLNELEIFPCGIGISLLNTKCHKNIWTESGPEFGINMEVVMIVARSLYSLNISGNAWRKKLADI